MVFSVIINLIIYVRIQKGKPVSCYDCLKFTKVITPEKNLPLKIAFGNHVVINYPDMPDTPGTQILKNRCSESPNTDDQYAGLLQFLLSFFTNFLQHYLLLVSA